MAEIRRTAREMRKRRGNLRISLIVPSTPKAKNSTNDRPRAVVGSGLYVDMENLQNHGQRFIQNLIADWPDSVPKPVRLTLAVRADQTELWRLWATSRFEWLDIVVRETQRFSSSTSKNSADIAIATSAMADWLLGRVSHIAIFSDDSDFVSLYASIRDELALSLGSDKVDVPFLWVVTDRESSLSPTAKRFFPEDKLHVVSIDDDLDGATVEAIVRHIDTVNNPYTSMAKAIVRHIDVGIFKSTDCQDIIQVGWPDHPITRADSPRYGEEFKTNIWPILEQWGVKITGKQPVQYEMTEAAKSALGSMR